MKAAPAKTSECLVLKRATLIQELARMESLVRGTLVRTTKTCGRKKCSCRRGNKHPHTFLSTSIKGRTRTVYVRREQEDAFMEGISAYHKAWDLIEKISIVNIQILRQGSAHE